MMLSIFTDYNLAYIASGQSIAYFRSCEKSVCFLPFFGVAGAFPAVCGRRVPPAGNVSGTARFFAAQPPFAEPAYDYTFMNRFAQPLAFFRAGMRRFTITQHPRFHAGAELQ